MTIFNSTVLSNLCGVDRLRLLKDLFGKVVIPLQVYEEILEGMDRGYAFLQKVENAIVDEHWMEVTHLSSEKEMELFREHLNKIDYGEAACISIAKGRGFIFFSDDKVARSIAKGEGLQVSGTIGMLKLAVERGVLHLQEADEILRRMLELGYRSPIRSLRELEGL